MAAVLVAQAPSTAQQTPSCSMAQDGDLGIDSSLLYESFTDAVAHCAAGAYLSLQAFVHVSLMGLLQQRSTASVCCSGR